MLKSTNLDGRRNYSDFCWYNFTIYNSTSKPLNLWILGFFIFTDISPDILSFKASYKVSYETSQFFCFTTQCNQNVYEASYKALDNKELGLSCIYLVPWILESFCFSEPSNLILFNMRHLVLLCRWSWWSVSGWIMNSEYYYIGM